MSNNNQFSVEELNKLVDELHKKHYQSSPCGLIQPDEAPNANTIYHLYNDGEITSQKGGFAYKKRTEFTIREPLYSEDDISPYKFPVKLSNTYSYAILTEEECRDIRSKMNKP